MDAWTIYWILQLDSVVGLFVGLTVVASVATLGFGLAAVFNTGSYGDDDVLALSSKWLKRSLAVAAVSLGASCFIPSSRTAAAMVILPAIANNQTIQREAGDLYQLAKEALRRAVTDESSEKK